jgi:hypothetical protein
MKAKKAHPKELQATSYKLQEKAAAPRTGSFLLLAA